MIIHRAWQPPGEKANFIPNKYGAAFRTWLAEAQGKHLLELEFNKLNKIVPTLFGYTAVIIGEPNFAYCLQNSKIKKRYLINENETLTELHDCKLICSRQDMLPIDTQSVDLVYLAHTLEFAHAPHEVLREVYRILRPDGHLILTMFNPLSSWGAWRLLAKTSNKAPWVANFMSAGKLRDWLALLGFDIMRLNYFGFGLPIGNSVGIFERQGQKLDLPIGAAYLIEASKRVIPLTPIGQAWKAKPDVIAEDIVEPTT